MQFFAAIEYFNQALLWGLFVAIAPIIIHLLFRQRYRRTLWAAMEFLLAAIKRTRRRMRLEQLLLMLLRMLILMLLVFVLARPYVVSGDNSGNNDTGSARYSIIIIDNSMSMGVNDANGVKFFEKAKERVMAYLDTFKTDRDTITLVLMADNPEISVKETTNVSDVSTRIRELQISEGGTNIMRAMDAAFNLMKDAKKPNKEILLISDFQRCALESENGPKEGDIEGIVQKYEQMKDAGKGRISIRFVDVGDGENADEKIKHIDNTFISEIFLRGAMVGRDIPTQLYIKIAKSLGTNASKKGKALMFLDNPETTDQGVPKDLSPDRNVNEVFDMKDQDTLDISIERKFPQAGSRIARIDTEFTDENLTVDNSRFYSIVVKDNIEVLLVDGEPKSNLEGELDRVMVALKPPLDEDERDNLMRYSPMNPTKISESEFFDMNPSELAQKNYDVIVLGNIRLDSMPERHIHQLESYINSGGSLLVYLGNRTENAERANTNFYKDGHGLLPCELVKIVGHPRNEPTAEASTAATPNSNLSAFHIGRQLVSHPAFQIFSNSRESSFGSVLIYQYYQVKPYVGKSRASIKDIPDLELRMENLAAKSSKSDAEINEGNRLEKLVPFLKLMKEKADLEDMNRKLVAEQKKLSPDEERKLKELSNKVTSMEKQRQEYRVLINKRNQAGGLSSADQEKLKELVKTVVFLEEDSNTEIICRFTAAGRTDEESSLDDPMILSRDFGQGKVIVWTTNVDGTWNNIHTQPAFLPLLHEMIYYLTRQYRGKRNFEVGTRFELMLQENPRDAILWIPSDNGEFQSVSLSPKPEGTEYRISHDKMLTKRGPYLLQINWGTGKKLQNEWYAVNTPLSESQLEYYNETSLREFFKKYAPKIDFTYLFNPDDAKLKEGIITVGKDHSMSILLFLLGFLLLESFLAWFFWWRRTRSDV